MLFSNAAGACLLAFASLSAAEKIRPQNILWGEKGRPTTLLDKRATATSSATTASTSRVADSSCSNGPFTRTCWSNGFSAATDFDAKWPVTGKTVSYNFDIVNTTCAPDGQGARPCQLFNGIFPGPLVRANWGDTISVTFTNKLTTNGTGIHWHGIRQLNTGSQDGVPGITECPLAPGQSKTYTWLATQFGTTWFHSHFSAQYGDGATGQIIIDGPASSNYDVDLGAFPVTDWYYRDSWVVGLEAHNNLQNFAPPPPADTILINGTNVANSSDPKSTGAYSKTTGLVAGKKYRLRLINTSVDNALRVSLDGHPFTVITSDLVPIKPWTTNWILIGIGQRYDVIFTATKDNAAIGNFWLRVNYASDCRSSGNNNPKALGIFSYNGAPAGNPTTNGTADPGGCVEPLANLVPWVSNTVDSTAFVDQVKDLEVNIDVGVNGNGKNIVVWGVNLTGIDVTWEKPTTQYVMDGNTSYPSTFNLIELPTEGIWAYWIIQETDGSPVPIPHPIHLHGHDFYVLGTGSGVFNKTTSPSTLKYTNPPRRDTAFLPAGGWLAIAFPTDNPGAWIMHCHIAWHVSDGLAVQFLEGKDSPKFPKGDAAWEQNCKNWNVFQATMPFPKEDSGV